jgi:hypothetical protein
MLNRAALPCLLAIALVLTGLAAVVGQTRMAAAGGYCGPGQTQLLLDAAGLPILDASGEAVSAPDCPACHLTVALGALPPEAPLLDSRASDVTVTAVPTLSPVLPLIGGKGRAPPLLA